MKKPDTIFLASGNTHKIEELKQVLQPLGIMLKSTLDYPDAEEVVEDQPDLQGNALKKAKFWWNKTGLPSISDDTGLEVDALNGAPGVYSARYAGENPTYDDNVNKLLTELKKETNRSAQFRTVIAFVDGSENYFLKGFAGAKLLMRREEIKDLDMIRCLFLKASKKPSLNSVLKRRIKSATEDERYRSLSIS